MFVMSSSASMSQDLNLPHTQSQGDCLDHICFKIRSIECRYHQHMLTYVGIVTDTHQFIPAPQHVTSPIVQPSLSQSNEDNKNHNESGAIKPYKHDESYKGDNASKSFKL